MRTNRDHTSEFKQEDRNENRVLAGFSYFGLLCFVPFLATDSPFAHFHAKQGTVFFLNDLLLLVLIMVLSGLRRVEAIAKETEFFLGLCLLFFVFFNLFMFLYGCINAFRGKAKELPLIGRFGRK